jgi:hypothetical protein
MGLPPKFGTNPNWLRGRGGAGFGVRFWLRQRHHPAMSDGGGNTEAVVRWPGRLPFTWLEFERAAAGVR